MLRPLLVILTLGALLVALFQVTGRVTMTLLDELEPAANRLLESRGMAVQGLSGGWRMLNPVIRAERLALPAGHVTDVVLEIDMVESVLRGTLLARRLQVGGGDVTVVKPRGEPWRLAGEGPPARLDVGPFLEHSNQIDVVGRLTVVREGQDPARLDLEYLGLNRGGEHRHALTVRNEPAACRADCSLHVDLHRRDRLWPLEPERTRVIARSEGFRLPRPVLGLSPVEVLALDLGWQRAGADSGGTLALRAEQLDMPGGVSLAVAVEGAVRGRDGVHLGGVEAWRVEQGDEVWTLPPMTLTADEDRIVARLPSLDLERAGRFLRQALAGIAPAERWLTGLDPRGTARQLRVVYDREDAGLSYAMSLDEVDLEGFKGTPSVRNGGGELIGYEQGVQVTLNARNVELAFPDVFTGEWHLPYARGVIQGWFGRDYFGIRGLNLRGEAEGTVAAGGFAMTRPPDREGQRLLLLLESEAVPVAQAQEFVPYKLPDALKSWLLEAPRGGRLHQARLAYQGQFQERPGELGRRIELEARLRDGHVRYHPDWPEVTALDGDVTVAGPRVDVRVARASSAGARIEDSRVRVVDQGGAVELSIDAQADADAVLDFLRTTPLSERLGFIEPDWQSAGPMRLSGELRVPIGDRAGEPAVRLRGDLEGVDLSLPGYRIDLAALDGSFRYRYPHQVDAAGVRGRLFGEPVTLAADTGGGRVHLRFDGRASAADVWRVIDVEDPGIAQGRFAFDADLGIAVGDESVSELTVVSDLAGATISLPAGYGKQADEEIPSRMHLRFLPEHRSVGFDYRDASGWLHFDQQPLRGAIGFDALPVAEQDYHAAVAELPGPEGYADAADAARSLVLSGRVAGFALEEVVPADAAGTAGDALGDAPPGPALLPMPLRLKDLEVGEIGVGEFPVTAATLNGLVTEESLALAVDSIEVTGTVARRGDAPLQVDLARVAVPAGEGEGDGDPLDTAVIADLPAADVTVASLTLGGEDYGRWRMKLRPAGGDLVVEGLEAHVRGLDIHASDTLLWQSSDDQTRFQGRLTAGNLAEVLPQWGYAPSVETASASLTGDVTWAGSPLAFDLLGLRGQARAVAEQGRFLDVESGAGAQKIFSLLNFTAIAKRVSLNFSDVFGRGVSFDELTADFELVEGMLEFLEPMEVEGTGSKFRVTGTVDLSERRLDNEMVVTLPVSQSLPWYAAYVALANPLAGLGVLVGERVLRKPLEQFSSARYHIGGTLDEPDVRLISVFDVTPEEALPAGGAPDGEPDGAPDGGAVGDPATEGEALGSVAPGSDESAGVASSDATISDD